MDYDDFEAMFNEPVTMSATGKPERISDTPVTMDVITADDIRRSGARDLLTLLRALPGISAYRGYNGIQDFTVGAVFLDGREIYLSTFGDQLSPALPVDLDEIRQIEVIRGPQSALYGLNSGEGVINIITYDPAKNPLNYVRGRVGDDARREAAAVVTQSLAPGIGLRLTAITDHADLQTGQADVFEIRPPNDPNRLVLAMTLSAWLPNGDHASFEASHTDISSDAMLPQITEWQSSRLQTDNVKLTYAGDTLIGRVTGSLSNTVQKIPEAYENEEISPFDLQDRTIDARLGDLFKVTASDSVRLEGEIRREDVHTTISMGSYSTMLLAGSAMWDHQFGPDWSLVNSARYYVNHNRKELDPGQPANSAPDYTGHGLAYNASLIYKLTHDDSLRAMVSRGLGLPSPLDFEQLGLPALIRERILLASDPNLDTSASLEYRLGWDHHIPAWEAEARISLFNKQGVDAYSLLPLQLADGFNPECNPATPALASYCNQLGGQSALSAVFDGVQLQLDHKGRDGWRWGFNYSLEWVHQHATAFSEEVVPQLRAGQTDHKLNANIGYGWSDWTLDLRLLYSSPIDSLTLNVINGLSLGVDSTKEVVSLSPHLAWTPSETITLDLAADNLWPYREDLLQKVGTAYFLSLKVAY